MDSKARRRWRREHREELANIEAFLSKPPQYEFSHIDHEGTVVMRRKLFEAFGYRRDAYYWEGFLKGKRVMGNVP